MRSNGRKERRGKRRDYISFICLPVGDQREMEGKKLGGETPSHCETK